MILTSLCQPFYVEVMFSDHLLFGISSVFDGYNSLQKNALKYKTFVYELNIGNILETSL